MVISNHEQRYAPTELSDAFDPQNYRKALRGELDAIVLMALQKEPAARYNSALAFAEDIEAYLGNMPIRARKATTLLLTVKFLRRHIILAIISVFVFTGLTLMLAITISRKEKVKTALEIAEQARIKAEKEKEIAEAETEKAEEIADVIHDFISISDPYLNPGEDIAIADLLLHGRRRIQELDSQPYVKVSLMLAMAELYKKMGAFNDLERLVTQALDLALRMPEVNYKDVSNCYRLFYEVSIARSDLKSAKLHIEKMLESLDNKKKPYFEFSGYYVSLHSKK